MPLSATIFKGLQHKEQILAEELSVKQCDEALFKDLLHFEEVFGDLSAAFVNITPEEVDTAICQGLQFIVKSAGVDGSAFLQVSQESGEIVATHSWPLENRTEMIGRSVNETLPYAAAKLLEGKTLLIEKLDDLPPEASAEKALLEELGRKSVLVVPTALGDSAVCALTLYSIGREVKWGDTLIRRLRLVADVFANALMRKRAREKLHDAFKEISDLKDRLEAENVYLRGEVTSQREHEEIIGSSRAIQKVFEQVEQVAPTDSTVLINGETGTGKELIAWAIHKRSARRDRPMVKVNCAALPATLIENELFGSEKGAYTGSAARHIGRFEVADGSSIFLDEIGELSPELQVKLLGVLEDGAFQRLGSSKTIRVDVRLISATNRDLVQFVRQGRFREDLYYRLNVFPLEAPPLRERREDIPVLVWHFIKEFEVRMNKRIESVRRDTLEAMTRYPWHGNVRELRNIVEHAMIVSKGKSLDVQLPNVMDAVAGVDMTLEDVEKKHILRTLESCGWRIRGRNGAAELLGLNPSTLYSRMNKLGIKRHDG